jgi:hypothetical protein
MHQWKWAEKLDFSTIQRAEMPVRLRCRYLRDDSNRVGKPQIVRDLSE